MNIKKMISIVFFFVLYGICFSNIEDIKNPDVRIWGISSEEINKVMVDGDYISNVQIEIKDFIRTSENIEDFIYIVLIRNPETKLYNNKDSYYYKEDKIYTEEEKQQMIQHSINFAKANFTKEESDIIINLINNPDPNSSSVDREFTTKRVNNPAEKYGHILKKYTNSKIKENLILNLFDITDAEFGLFKSATFGMDGDTTKNSYLNNGFIFFKSYDGSYKKVSSSLLAFMEYVGAGKSFGIMFVPKESGSFSASRISIEVSIDSFLANKETKKVVFITNRPPVLSF